MRTKVNCLLIAYTLFPCAFAGTHSNNSITPDSAENYLVNYCYDIMQYQTHGRSFIFPANIASDETYAGGGILDDYELCEIDSFSLDSDNGYVESLWEKYYESIERCNLLLGAIGPDAGVEYNRFAAEAKCLRAYFYFCLVRYYGGVPLWISDDINQLNNLARATSSEVYTQIEKDLSEAAPYLPLRSGLAGGENFRLTSGAAHTLLGKVYLFQQKWSQAIGQFDAVINTGEYYLLPDFSEIWETTNEFSYESIFEIPFTSVQDDWDRGNYDVMLMAYRGGISSGNTYRGGWGLCPVAINLVEAYQAQNDTIRLNASVVDEATILDDGCTIDDSRQYTGYFNNKYASLAADYIHDFYSEKNEIILRYADILLMYAESLYHLGNEITAQAYLNLVRERVYLDEIHVTGEELLEAIQEERRLEFALEGSRFFDLVRWDKAITVLANMGYQPHNNVWPIPASAFFINPNLTQNPGYSIPVGIMNRSLPVNELEAQLFPNPATSILNLSFNLPQTGDVIISVYSVYGKEVVSYKLFNRPAGGNRFEVDLCNIQNGVYSVTVKSGGNKSVLKAVILK